MSGKKIGIEQFSKPVNIQPNKTNDVLEVGIEKILQSQTKKIDSSKPYHLEKEFRFPDTMFATKSELASMNGSKNIHS